LRPIWRSAYQAELRTLVEAAPDITLAELQTELQRRCGVRAGLSTIHNRFEHGPPVTAVTRRRGAASRAQPLHQFDCCR
jgi:hypothetical protein